MHTSLLFACLMICQASALARTDSHLQFFGYYWSQLREPTWVFSGNTAAQNGPTVDYIEEYYKHTNLTWVLAQTIDDPTTSYHLAQARRYNQRVVLDVSGLFYKRKYSDEETKRRKVKNIMVRRSADVGVLKSEFAAFWQKQIVNPGFVDLIELVYTLDEPFKNRDPLAELSKMERERIKAFDKKLFATKMKVLADDLHEINLIAKEVSHKKIGAILHPSMASNELVPVPTSYDWVGFSCYSSLDSCGGQKRSVEQIISSLLSRMHVSQKIILVAETWQNTKELVAPQVLGQRLTQMHKIALRQQRVVALVPFIWRSYSSTSRGARDIPELLPLLREMGGQLTSEAVDI